MCWLAHEKLSYNFFDDDATQNFFKTMNSDYSTPKRNSVKRIALNEFEKMKGDLKAALQQNTSKFSFNVDGWTARNSKSFYGITIHYIDEEWDLQSVALDFIFSNAQHTG